MRRLAMNIFLDPNVAYVLLVFGFMLAILAVLTPGTGILEVVGLFALGLAGWSVYILEVNVWALAVLILGVFPFLIAVRRSGQMIYLAVAIGALVVGSLFLFRGEGLRPAVNPILALVSSVISGGFLWFASTKTLEASQARPAHDLSGLIGQVGETRTAVHEEGSVYIAGEMWTAYSKKPIPNDERVRVIGREGFLLEVEPLEPDTMTDEGA
jgi:membrane-bound serine protease (ClpP class)